MTNLEIKKADGKANIYTPYNPEFVRAIKQIGGARWNPEEKCWSVAETAIDAVRQIMSDVYGYSDISANDVVTVKATFKHEVTATCGSVILLGKTVSRAYGRDSGAKVGEDVVFLSGGATSGGSRANWESVVTEGSVVRMHNVSKALLQNEELPYGVTIEVVDSAIDREQLTAEKARLLQRIAEIEKLLAE